MIGLMPNQTLQALSTKFASLEPLLDERTRRLWAAAEARAIGRGGITLGSGATGLSRGTIRAGAKELHLPVGAARGTARGHRVLRCGGGRKALARPDPKL